MKLCPVDKPENAMNLVDVVMAVAVLGIMAGGLFGSFRYGFLTIQCVRENQRATQILLEKAETIRLYNWDQVNSNGFIPATFTNVYDPQAVSGAQGATFTGTLAVATCAGTSYSTNMRQLTVAISWSTRDIPHTRTLTTYIAKDGMQNYVY